MNNLNYLGIKTIIYYEIRDFLKEFQFNIIAPLVTTLLFVLVLSLINTHFVTASVENSYIQFLIPGIIMMVVIQTSYNHLSEVIINMKQIGSFNDYLMSPLSRIEIFFSFVTSSIVVSIIVGFTNLAVLFLFVDYNSLNFFKLFYYLFLTSVFFSSFGAIIGLISYTWDTHSSIYNFIIVPISFFSGTFFSIDSLDPKYDFIFLYNPFYYLVDNFRSVFFNEHYFNPLTDSFIFFYVIFFFLISLLIFHKGYRVVN